MEQTDYVASLLEQAPVKSDSRVQCVWHIYENEIATNETAHLLSDKKT